MVLKKFVEQQVVNADYGTQMRISFSHLETQILTSVVPQTMKTAFILLKVLKSLEIDHALSSTSLGTYILKTLMLQLAEKHILNIEYHKSSAKANTLSTEAACLQILQDSESQQIMDYAIAILEALRDVAKKKYLHSFFIPGMNIVSDDDSIHLDLVQYLINQLIVIQQKSKH